MHFLRSPHSTNTTGVVCKIGKAEVNLADNHKTIYGRDELRGRSTFKTNYGQGKFMRQSTVEVNIDRSQTTVKVNLDKYRKYCLQNKNKSLSVSAIARQVYHTRQSMYRESIVIITCQTQVYGEIRRIIIIIIIIIKKKQKKKTLHFSSAKFTYTSGKKKRKY